MGRVIRTRISSKQLLGLSAGHTCYIKVLRHDIEGTHHELCKLLVELLLVRHGRGGGEGLQGEAAPASVRDTVGDLRGLLPAQTPTPAPPRAPPPPHLGVELSGAAARLHTRLPLEAGELRSEAGAHLPEVGLGQLRSVDLGESQASEHLSQTGAREPVAEAIKLHIGERVQDLETERLYRVINAWIIIQFQHLFILGVNIL